MAATWDDDDDDAFLYGDEGEASGLPPMYATSLPPSNGVAHPPAESIHPMVVEPETFSNQTDLTTEVRSQPVKEANFVQDSDAEGEGEPLVDEIDEETKDEDDVDLDAEDSESDVEIIMEDVVPARSVDFRNQAGIKPFVPPRPSASTAAAATSSPIERRPVHLTTEYTPRDRPPSGVANPPYPPKPTPKPEPSKEDSEQLNDLNDIKVDAPKVTIPEPVRASGEEDTSTGERPSVQGEATEVDPSLLDLPPARAAASAPKINPSAPGHLPDKTSVYDIDMNNMGDKAWRRPGSDLSDWFNYGFDEISWEAYCVRRRELGESAAVLKGAVLNLAALPEEQIQHIPPEMRSTLIAQASLMGVGMPPGPGMISGAGGGGGGMMAGPQGMILGHGGGPGGGSMDMGMGMGMGMPDMMMNGMMGMHPHQHPHQHQHQMNGMNAGGPVMGGPNMMSMGPGGMMVPPSLHQDSQINGNVGVQAANVAAPVGLKIESPDVAAGAVLPTANEIVATGDTVSEAGPAGTELAATPNADFGPQDPSQAAMRQQDGYGMDPAVMRGGFRGGVRGGRGGFAGARGGAIYAGARGRGGGAAGIARPVSPLPSNVPTGPRNQNRYKDKDREATDSKAVVEIDYGGSVSGSRGSAEREREKDRDRERDRDRDSHRDRKDKDRDRERDRERDSRRESSRRDREHRDKDDDSHRDKDRRDGTNRKEKDDKGGSSSSRKRKNSTSEDGRETGRSSKRR